MRLALREALAAFRRAPLLSVLGIVTIAFSLFAFGLFGLVAVNIRSALMSVEERVEIRAFIADGTPVEAVATAMGDIGSFPEVIQVSYVTPEQALARARTELGEFSDVFESAFLPASMDIRLRPGFRDPGTVRSVAARVGAYEFVDDVRYGQDWVQKLYDLRNVATAAGTGLGIAFFAVAIIIIGATIRTAVLARSREIWIMRLVGATDGFVRAPFLIEGFIKGVLGGTLALLLTWLAHRAISQSFVQTVFFSADVAFIGILAGALMGFLGSLFSVGRHLRQV
jgi:cell division transport system permease protein